MNTTLRDELRKTLRRIEATGDHPVAAEVTRTVWHALGGRPDADGNHFIEVDGLPFYPGTPAFGEVLWISAARGSVRSIRDQRLAWMRNADVCRKRTELEAVNA